MDFLEKKAIFVEKDSVEKLKKIAGINGMTLTDLINTMLKSGLEKGGFDTIDYVAKRNNMVRVTFIWDENTYYNLKQLRNTTGYSSTVIFNHILIEELKKLEYVKPKEQTIRIYLSSELISAMKESIGPYSRKKVGPRNNNELINSILSETKLDNLTPADQSIIKDKRVFITLLPEIKVKLDEQAIKNKSSISAILENLLRKHFNIVE